ncbi:S8 family serine peptidase [Arthrobacter cavernae]|uniref:S8 family serine peptidase n=1 Tax=Arthrobacter cavernae TaxID=2817681 RepID=A0A939KHI9_9MICC|nr:S8 family serine peptidase [Arthrobacter cavernae]MBO1266622.1 S8 family serine peptidase [Arthrobacter cavernae]
MKKIAIASFAALVMGFGAITFAVPGNAATRSSGIAGQIMVKFRDNGAAAGVLRQHGLSQGAGIGSTGAHLIKVPAGKESQLIEALSRNPAVEYAEPDELVTAATADQYFDRQYALHNVGQSFTNTSGTLTVAGGIVDADVDAVEAWSITKGSGIRVAVLDTGVASGHDIPSDPVPSDNRDLESKVVARANFSTAATGKDNYGHGTHVAGIVAATADNTIGVAGVCPECTILDGKVLNDSGSGSTSAIANGINWAVNNGAKVINMSLGQSFPSRTLETAVNNAWKAGVVIVAAAGNGGTQAKFYPGAYRNVIAVAATDNRDAKASFSSYGAQWVDVAAPGVNVFSTFPNHPFVLDRTNDTNPLNDRSQGYDIASGTSMASPIVAAVAALAWSSHPGTTNALVRDAVELTADNIGGTDTYWEHGRVNAYNAVR